MKFLTFAGALASTVLAYDASAATYTFVDTPDDLSGPATFEGFEGFALGTSLPVTSGILTVATGQDWPGAPTTLNNASSIETPGIIEGKYFWSNRDAKDYTFTFTQGVSEFGVGLWGMQFPGNTLTLFDVDGQQIQSFSVNGISASGLGAQYVGFTGSQPDVFTVVLDFSATDAVGIDNVSYTTSVVPLPAGLPLLLAGLGGIAVLRKRRH